MRNVLFAVALVLAACASLGGLGLHVSAESGRPGVLASFEASATAPIPAATTSSGPEPVTSPTPPVRAVPELAAQRSPAFEPSVQLLAPTPDPARNALLLFESMNAARAAEGLHPLAWSSELELVAQARADHLIEHGYFGHHGPDGSSAFTELRARGAAYAIAGENLARNTYPDAVSPSVAFEALMASPGHRANILEPRFHSVGVVAVRDGAMWLYVTVFLG